LRLRLKVPVCDQEMADVRVVDSDDLLVGNSVGRKAWEGHWFGQEDTGRKGRETESEVDAVVGQLQLEDHSKTDIEALVASE